MINCKVTNGEAVADKHRVLVMDWEMQWGKKIQIQIHLFGHIADPGDLC